MKKLFLIAFALTWLAAPVSTYAQAESDAVENSLSGITLTVNGTKVHVTGANGENMEIFNLTGVKVSSISIDSADKSLTLTLPKGCYILKVGKVVRKISIR
ncbi:MAG: T9SS type A sorting domain-containing protein [Bacteroidaceae bacterium]|jgi:hypothetical protein|nr:T9SS type A sorting domain-containing protein [Bacteroidaceae bacterium]MBQ7989347.1 T9SS type A sorting domain-containing protein [Bacteroidaceae bacterium]